MMFGMRGGGGQERLQVEIRGYDLTVSEALARQVQAIVKTVKGVTDTRAQPRDRQSRGAPRHRPPGRGRHEALGRRDRRSPSRPSSRGPRRATSARRGASSASWSRSRTRSSWACRTSST
ncbi:MAG: hypothetical protein M0C28_46330 [Candidatus Moduliflexus flocculans]|nr:hypothetical protein [Candidatus Moduliflexus flocculans]